MNPNGQSALKKHHPFYSTSKEFLQKGKVEQKQNRWPRSQMLNPFWLKSRLRVSNDTSGFFLGLFKKTDIQSWWVGVRFPPKKKYGLIFPFFPKVFEEIKLLGYFWVLLQQSHLGPSNLMFFPPWKSRKHHESVEPRTLVHLENDIILILLAWEAWKLLRDCEMLGDSYRELKNYNQGGVMIFH